jgi:hypothetical protein
MTGQVVWILVEGSAAFPSLIYMNELVEAIDKEMLVRADDPFINLAYITPEPGSTSQVKRDRNYDLIKLLIDDPFYFDPKVRSSCINEIIGSKGSTKQTLYKLARRYWQRGQTPNALIPDYKNSGGKGKKRTTKDKKLGRPRKFMPGIGVIVDANVERLFRIAINKYLLKDSGCSFPYAHRRFKDLYENYYPNTPESEIPTNWQMLHFYKREYGQVEKIQKRTNKINFNKDVQPLSSTANTQALGPGSRFEIDATIADIYLVSDSDRRDIVGRPIIYMVIDVFSRMVAGFYIGFENPSYVAAIQALGLAMTNKVDYCKRYGFDITEDEWPIVGLPDAILGDRGELIGHQIESLESSFSVRIENTAPYRGDAKGIVERSFRTIQAEFKPFAPGVVTKTKIKKRGGKDYRLDATLTIKEFKEIILSSILVHNQFDTLEKYDRHIDMPADLIMTPLSIWNWGLQHRTGRLRAASEDALRISLYPRIKGTFSELGLCVFGIYYTSPEIIQKGWLHRSKEAYRPVALEVAYDPASADRIYLFPEKNKAEYWVCKLTPRSREFVGCSFWEVWQVQTEQKTSVARSRLLSDEKRRQHEQFVASKIKSSKSRAPNTNDMTNTERIRAIRNNRRKERDEERRESTYSSESKTNNLPATVVSIREQQHEDYSFPDHLGELFDDDEEDS